MPDLSSTGTQAVLAQDCEEIWCLLLTIDHADLAEPIRITNCYGGLTSNGNEFQYFPFSGQLPKDSEELLSGVAVTMGNIGKVDISGTQFDLIEKLLEIHDPFTCKVQVVLESDPDTIEDEWEDLELSSWKASVPAISANLSFDQNRQEIAPYQKQTPGRCPSLYGVAPGEWPEGTFRPAAKGTGVAGPAGVPGMAPKKRGG